MKKTVYYFSPFVLSLVLMGIFSIFEIKSSVPMIICLCIYAVVMGMFSPARGKFDYLVTALLPLSLILALFICVLCDNGFDFSLAHALNIEYYLAWLPMYLVTAGLAFVASIRPIRIQNRK